MFKLSGSSTGEKYSSESRDYKYNNICTKQTFGSLNIKEEKNEIF